MSTNIESNKNNDETPPQKSLIARIGISPIAFLVTAVVSIVFLPTFVLLLGGMLPSIVAFVLDDTTKKSKAKTIAYLNLAGCFIIGMDLWTGENSVDAALSVFLVPVNWVIVYGLALFGWILIRSLNPFITSYLRLSYQVQQRNLRKRRKSLLHEWGEAVAAVSNKGEFIYDNNVYLDEDEIHVDPDEEIDQIPEDEIKGKPVNPSTDDDQPALLEAPKETPTQNTQSKEQN